MKIRGLGLLAAFIFSASISFAQEGVKVHLPAAEAPKGWHLLDADKDGFRGISLQKAYEFLKGKKSQPIIVAVLDSGIDTTHEDLKTVLWRNPKEIPGNGVDDDGNGYVDDVYGWNFLGNAKGEVVQKASSEMARVYHRFKDKYQGKTIDVNQLSATEKAEYQMWKQAEKEITPNPEDQLNVAFIDMALSSLKKYDKVLREEMKKDDFTIEELERYQTVSTQARQAKSGYLGYAKLFSFDSDTRSSAILHDLDEYVDQKRTAFTAKDNPPADLRKEVIGDNYYDFNDRFYGNSNVMGGGPVHGTHVTGIIAAVRNGIGADGVADNVQIMTLRTVPNGDEYDKDIALAIRYAVDHGAKIINMSFGKAYSPEKHWVDEAIRYAESKDVLLVHAAGNDARDLETLPSFPSPYFIGSTTKAPNFITVGASSDPSIKGDYVADFTNYGKNTVDVFAPGVKIFSTLPGGNQYGNNQGTSMAAPVVSGIAALIWSYYPHLTAAQVKEAIESSVWRSDNTWVSLPGDGKKRVRLGDLSVTAGIVNAYEAVKYADSIRPADQKKNRK